MNRNDFQDPLRVAIELVTAASVTPDTGTVTDRLERILSEAGFVTEKLTFSAPNTPDVVNLFAKIGSGQPHLTFAGHLDVVPVGNESDWSHAPFSAAIEGGKLYGRGTADMKGGIAAFVAAALAYRERRGTWKGTLSFLITGDEEGPAINGTVKLLEWAAARGERFDAALVGEPTNPEAMGDAIKVGRRGSLSGTMTVHGQQGHVAYPHHADNPIRGLVSILNRIHAAPIDSGSARFEPSNFEVVSIDVGNPAWNVIPAKATARFNIRFNDLWDRDRLEAWLKTQIEAASQGRIRASLILEAKSADSFVTENATLIGALADAVEAETGRRPTLSTEGGTSDARFIKNYCPVVEFGLVSQTIHQIDEHVAIDDLRQLARIYGRFLDGYFGG